LAIFLLIANVIGKKDICRFKNKTGKEKKKIRKTSKSDLWEENTGYK